MKKTLFLLGLLLLFLGCGDKNKEAFEALEEAQSLYANSEYSSAKIILDSLKSKYPEDANVQRARLDLQKEIELAEMKRNLLYADSLLPIKQAELEAILPQFQYEKNEEYEDLGRYIDKAYNPSFEKNSHFLKAIVNERGEMDLISSYSGSDAGHTYIKVSDASGNYAETQVVERDGGVNYSFKDSFGRSYETVTFRNGADNGVVMFIYNYGDGKLTIERLGGKKISPTVLTDKEKQSIKRMTNLSTILREVDNLQREKIRSEARIEYLEVKNKELPAED